MSPLCCNAFGPSITTAAAMIGMLIRKLNSAALSRSKRRARPVVIVEPERDTPGMSAITWERPISNESTQRISPRIRAWAVSLSASHRTIPMTMRAIAITCGLRKADSALDCSKYPPMAPGIVAMIR